MIENTIGAIFAIIIIASLAVIPALVEAYL